MEYWFRCRVNRILGELRLPSDVDLDFNGHTQCIYPCVPILETPRDLSPILIMIGTKDWKDCVAGSGILSYWSIWKRRDKTVVLEKEKFGGFSCGVMEVDMQICMYDCFTTPFDIHHMETLAMICVRQVCTGKVVQAEVLQDARPRRNTAGG